MSLDINLYEKSIKILSDLISFKTVSGKDNSPLIDYSLIDKMIRLSKKKNFDIFTNVFPRTFPKGFSVEIIKTNVFFNSYKYFKKNHKEHVSSYFYEKFENTLFVTHQDVIRAFTYYYLKDKDFWKNRPDHCEVQFLKNSKLYTY